MTRVAGELIRDANNIPVGWSSANITGSTTTVVKIGSGVLHSITFNKPVATGVLTVYDNTAGSGTVTGTITTPSSPIPVTLIYDIQFSIGLTIVSATAAQDITVSYI